MTTTQQKIIDRLGWAAIVAIVALGALLIIPLQADATGNRDDDDNQEQHQDQKQDQDQHQKQDQDQGQAQGQHQNAEGGHGVGIGKGGDASVDGLVGTGGESDVDVDISGDSYESEHNFLALSLMFPNASGCFKGGQGGVDDKDNFAAFLGIHILDKNCWADTLASRERDADINARLKCAGKFYRNAIAFDVKRRDRQQLCVDRVRASNLALIKEEDERLRGMLDEELQKRDEQISGLHRDVEVLDEKIATTDEKCDRQWESCTRK